MGEGRRIIETIERRKKNWIGHVVRGNGLLKLVLEGRMEGKRPRSRPRIGTIDDLKEGSYVNMKRRAEIESDGGFGCQGPTRGQRTTDNM